MDSILRVKDSNGNIIDIPALKGDKGKSAYQSAVDGGYQGTEEDFNYLLANISTIKERPVDITENLSAEQGFIIQGIDIGLKEGSFVICDSWKLLNEDILPVGTEIAKIEVRGQDDDPESGWIDINNMYERDESFMNIIYSKVFECTHGYRVFGVAIYQYNNDNFIIDELNNNKYPVARITYYTD